MTRLYPLASDLSDMLADRAEELCHQLLANGRREGAEWRVGSVGGEPGKSLGVHLTGPKAGVWCDFATGQGGDLLDLAAAVLELSTGTAIWWVRDWLRLGVTNGAEQVSKPKLGSAQFAAASAPDERRSTSFVRELWRQAQPPDGSPAEVYLRSRGVTIPIPPTIRYLPHTKHGPSGLILPAFIAAVQAPDRRISGLMRIFLTADGSGKAPVSNPKMMLGQIAGGAVRLASAGPRLAIAEGLETALSVAQVCLELPVWAALSTSGMRSLILPSNVREVTLCADGDAAGQEAAKAAAKRFVAEGRRVQIARPPAGASDFNDALQTAEVEEATS